MSRIMGRNGRVSEDEASPRVGRPRKWIPDAVISIRAKDDETADIVAEILADALGAHPDDVHVLFQVERGAPLTEQERRLYAERVRLLPIR